MSTRGLLRPQPRVVLMDDFLGDVIADQWNGRVGSNGSATLPAVQLTATAIDNGRVLLKTGNDAGGTMALNGCQLDSALNWICNKGGLLFESRVRLNAGITSVAWFVGFTDQVAALEMPFTLAAGNVLTSNASNAVGFLFDTDADTDNWWAVGVADDVDATKQDLGVAPVSGTFETLRVDINRSGTAVFRRNGQVIGSVMTGALQGPTSSDELTPVIAGFARGASQRQFEADYIYCEQNRV